VDKGASLCYKIKLHALQELLDIIQPEDQYTTEDDTPFQHTEQLCLTISVVAMSGAIAPNSMCMSGNIQGNQIRILVDSGSSHTFIGADLTAHLKGVSPLSNVVQVQVANEQTINCSEFLAMVEWTIEVYQFKSDLKVLPLSSYDMILGLDWLEAFSPMKVQWKDKWMAIPYDQSIILLLGDVVVLPVGSVLQLCSVQLSVDNKVEANIPVELQQLIEEFGTLFEVPSELPPPHDCDHSIPLVEGASPVNVRPYRFAPVLKDEIEKQIQEMLKNGIIQPSSNLFSSFVLLVKKKDNTWRFCADYCHLNAITQKIKYPVPLLLNSWMNCLKLLGLLA
jgi:hypothetical protein